jgi:hypothetical protein
VNERRLGMKIVLARTAVPNEMGPYTCGVCEEPFVVGTVTAWAWGSGGPVGEAADSVACPACVEVLGNYRSDLFPTIQQYRRLEAQWPTPEYASVEELERVEGPYA